MSIKITKAGLVEIGAILTSVYGVLSSTAVLNKLPTSISSILTVVGPVVVALFAYLNHPSTGTTTIPVTTSSGTVVNAPIAPVNLVTATKPAPVPTTVGNLGSPVDLPAPTPPTAVS